MVKRLIINCLTVFLKGEKMTDNKVFHATAMLMHTNRLHKAMIDSRVKDIGIHRTQHRILMHLAKCDRIPSQKELAEHLEVTPAAVTLAIKQIEKDGYIKRTLGKDSRFYEIEITEKGREMVTLTRELFSAVDAKMFDGFSDEELDNFIGFMERLQNNIKSQIPTERKNTNEKMV